MSIAGASVPEVARNLEECKAFIFQLYITDRLPLRNVIQAVHHRYGVTATPRQYTRKLERWGFYRNVRRIDVSAARRINQSGNVDINSLVSRTIPHRRQIENYVTRNKLERAQKASKNPAHTLELPPELAVPERFIVDVANLIKGSFESKDWKFNGLEFIISSSKNSDLERRSLHKFLTEVDLGCERGKAGDDSQANAHWDNATDQFEILLTGRYHDHLPNIIQKLNDLARQGQSNVAESMREKIAKSSRKHLEDGVKTSRIFTAFDDLKMDGMEELEERLMELFRAMFCFHLGEACYNSFVMMMNAARRRLTRCPWIPLDEILPRVEPLDEKYGRSNRRPLDVIRLKLELLHLREEYLNLLIEAPKLIERALPIQNDPWQRFYYLTKGYYYLGIAQLYFEEWDNARQSLEQAALSEIEFQLADPGTTNLFEFESQHIQEQLLQISRQELFATIDLPYDFHFDIDDGREEVHGDLHILDNAPEYVHWLSGGDDHLDFVVPENQDMLM